MVDGPVCSNKVLEGGLIGAGGSILLIRLLIGLDFDLGASSQ